jgi:sulfate transport system permease protein
MIFTATKKNILPGFGLTMGYTLLYLSLIVLIPLSTVVFKTATLSWGGFLDAVMTPRVLASFRLTFGTSFLVLFAVNLIQWWSRKYSDR